MADVKVYESGSGKWVQVHEGCVRYTSDSYSATAFDPRAIKSAYHWFEDFLIYRSTLFAVPIGSNHQPWECNSVTEYLKGMAADAAKEE